MTKPCGSCQLKPELSEGQAALGLNFKFACPFSSGIVRDRWRAVGLPLLALLRHGKRLPIMAAFAWEADMRALSNHARL